MKGHTVTLLCGLVLIIAACAPAAQQTTPQGTEPQTPPTPSTCTTKDCFITSANACTDLTITVTFETKGPPRSVTERSRSITLNFYLEEERWQVDLSGVSQP